VKARTEALNVHRQPQPGDTIAGKYRVEKVLGAGGMGVVLAATHLQLQQQVAIKMLLPSSLQNPELVARFDQEARATVKIQSEHVVKVLDVGREQGNPFMVMEYLDGNDLAAVLKRSGPLSLPDALGHVLQACEALAEAHKLGIVHRDLKPANLFLTRRADGSPLVKILDFGISKATLANGFGPAAGLTMDATVMGSPNYMSPEQLKNSKDVDARADIWSLGLVLYELLTGQVAFQADTLAELHVAILQSFPGSLRQRRPDLPPELEQVILRCLQKDRAFRFANVGELAQALDPFAPPASQVSVDRTARLLGLAPLSRVQSSSGWAPPPGSQVSGSSGWAPPAQNPQASGWVPPPPQAPPMSGTSGWAPPATPGAQAWGPPMPLASPTAVAPQAAPIWTAPPQQQQAVQRSGPPIALVILATIVGVVVVGGVGCVSCLGFLVH
jgi:serine/threonine-protein kinase